MHSNHSTSIKEENREREGLRTLMASSQSDCTTVPRVSTPAHSFANTRHWSHRSAFQVLFTVLRYIPPRLRTSHSMDLAATFSEYAPPLVMNSIAASANHTLFSRSAGHEQMQQELNLCIHAHCLLARKLHKIWKTQKLLLISDIKAHWYNPTLLKKSVSYHRHRSSLIAETEKCAI